MSTKNLHENIDHLAYGDEVCGSKRHAKSDEK